MIPNLTCANRKFMQALSIIFKNNSSVGWHFNIFAAQSFYLNRFVFFTFIFFISAGVSFAQNGSDSTTVPIGDSVIQKDTIVIKDSLALLSPNDSVSPKESADWRTKMPGKDTSWTINPSIPFFYQNLSWQLLQRHPYFGFSAPPVIIRSEVRQIMGKELLFYLLVFLLLIYALLRQAFPKYFNDLFRYFFRTTLKQRQISEQLMETPLPSLLLNGFFVVIGGLYITFLLQHFKLIPADNFWRMFLYCILSLSAIYFIKFIGLRISGWLFNMQEAANSYIFIVFIINKMIGILLLPFLILLAFTPGDIYFVSLTLSWCLVAGMLVYRMILTFGAVRNQVKVNPFHFFLYICAFEIAPLLLIYKGLLFFFRITA
jgi:Domain of unknown function (DUF4271)